MVEFSSLSWWLCWDDGYLRWYAVFVDEFVGKYGCVLWLFFVAMRAMRRAYTYAHKIFGRRGNLYAIRRS